MTKYEKCKNLRLTLKTSCFKCGYLFPGFKKFKCYCGDCPAKIIDDLE